MSAAIGSVRTHDISIPVITPPFAVPLTMPTPVMAPTDTCVVETGKPNRLAKKHHKRSDQIGAQRLSVIHCGNFFRHGLRHFAGVYQPAHRHGRGDGEHAIMNV